MSLKLALVSAFALVAGTAQANDVFAQVFTDWNVLVKEGADAHQCAQDISTQTGFEIREVLPVLGVVLVTAPTADASALNGVACVEVFEQDSVVTIPE